jgi:hypothetical protein
MRRAEISALDIASTAESPYERTSASFGTSAIQRTSLLALQSGIRGISAATTTPATTYARGVGFRNEVRFHPRNLADAKITSGPQPKQRHQPMLPSSASWCYTVNRYNLYGMPNHLGPPETRFLFLDLQGEEKADQCAEARACLAAP